MGYIADKEEQQRHTKFVAELTKLSKKYGIVLKVVGGVMVDDPKNPQLQNLKYTDDISSLDIMPNMYWE